MNGKAVPGRGVILLLPPVAAVSGMAVTPLLLALALWMLIAGFRERDRPEASGNGASINPLPLQEGGVKRSARKNLLTILALALIWPLLSAFWSITPGRSLASALSVMALCGIAGAAFLYLPILRRPPARLIRGYALSVAAAALLMLLETLPGGGLIGAAIQGLGMDYGRYIDKNVNRGLCALTLLVWPAVTGLCSLGMRRAGWGLLLLLLLPIGLMHSLSAQTGLVCGMLAFALAQWFPVRFPRMIAIAALLFLLGFPLLFQAAEIPSSIARHLPETAQQRLVIWRFVAERIAEKPWLGWGMDTARAIPGGAEIVRVHGVEVAQLPLHPHNSPLQLLLEEGVIGLLLTLGAVAAAFRRWLEMPVEDKARHAATGALIVSFLATGFSSFGIWQTWWIATLWAAILIRRSIATTD